MNIEGILNGEVTSITGSVEEKQQILIDAFKAIATSTEGTREKFSNIFEFSINTFQTHEEKVASALVLNEYMHSFRKSMSMMLDLPSWIKWAYANKDTFDISYDNGIKEFRAKHPNLFS
jgi:exonuclease V gamma subunit